MNEVDLIIFQVNIIPRYQKKIKELKVYVKSLDVEYEYEETNLTENDSLTVP